MNRIDFLKGILVGVLIMGLTAILMLVLTPAYMTKDYAEGYSKGYDYNKKQVCKNIQTPNLTGNYIVTMTSNCTVKWKEINYSNTDTGVKHG